MCRAQANKESASDSVFQNSERPARLSLRGQSAARSSFGSLSFWSLRRIGFPFSVWG